MAYSLHWIYIGTACLFAGVAVVTDLRSRRIPNWLTGPGFLLGLLLHLGFSGVAQAALALLAGLLAGGIFFVFFAAGGMGAGDVKLMAAVSCLVGMEGVRDVLIATVILGAVAALLAAMARGRLRETVANAAALLAHHHANGLTTHPELNVRNRSMLRLPYALPIAGGCMITLYLSVQGGPVR